MRTRTVLQSLTLFLITFSSVVQGGWSEAAQEFAESYDFKIEDGHLATVWGTCHAPNPRYDRMESDVLDWNVVNNDLYYRTLPTKIALARDSRGKLKKAPVMFFIPSAFNNLNDKMARQFMDRFTQMGMHTFVVPNPWGTDYVSRKPRTITGHIEAEARVLYDVFKSAHKYLQSQNLTMGDFHISGVSYGAFLSGMISALAANDASVEAIHFKSVTMISPPLKLGASLNHLDAILDETIDYTAMWFPRLARKYISLCRVDANDVGHYSHQDAMGLAAAQGFHAELIKSLHLYDKLWNLGTIPRNFWGKLSRKYRRWRQQMSFGTYFKTYNRGAAEIIDGPKGDLLYWIEETRQKSDARIQVLLASDDFLNDVKARKSLAHRLDSSELIELPTGGHFGFRALPWFDQFLGTAFSADAAIAPRK